MRKIRTFFMEEERRTRILLVLSLLAACMIVFRDYLFGDELLVFNDIGSDTYQLYTMHFASIINHLREGSLSFWDFTNGVGMNQFNLNLFDPSEIMVFVMGYFLGPGRVLFYLVLTQIVKIVAAGLVFYHYLSCFSFSRQAKFAAAFAYGLNGYLLVWGQHYQFGMVTVYFPLMLLFMEKYLQGKKSGRFLPVVVFLSGICSVYFSFMSLLGLGIYLIIRLCMMEKISFVQKAKRFFGGCLLILLGLGMSMVIFLPMASCILQVSGRLSSDETTQGVFYWLARPFSKFEDRYYQSILLRLFSSAFQTTGELADDSFEFWLNYYEDPVLFCSILTIVADAQLLLLYFRQKVSIRKKIFVYLTALLIIFSITFPLVGSMFNGLSIYSARFTFVLIPFLLLGMAWTWDYLRKGRRVSIILLVAFSALLVFVCKTGFDQSVFREYQTNAVITAVAGIGMAAAMAAASLVKKEAVRKASMWVLLMFLALNVVSEGWANYEDRSSIRRSDTPIDDYDAAVKLSQEELSSDDPVRIAYAKISYPQEYFYDLYNPNILRAISDAKRDDPEFYRMEKDFVPMRSTTAMDGLAQGYYGLTSYNSVQNAYVIDFVDTYCPEIHYPDRNHFIYAGIMRDTEFDAAMGVRYLISEGILSEADGFRTLGVYGDFYLYENLLGGSVGRFFTHTISEDSLRTLCSRETRNLLLTNVVALPDGDKIASIGEIPLRSEAEKASVVKLSAPARDDRIEGTAHLEEDGYLLFTIPWGEGWSVKIDGKEAELLRGDLGFIACKAAKGDHSLLLSFKAPGLFLGALITVDAWLIFVVYLLAASGKARFPRRKKR